MCIVIGATVIIAVKLSKDGGKENDASASDVSVTEEITSETTPSPIPTATPTPTVTNTPTPSPTPTNTSTPTPTPKPPKLKDLSDYSAGDVIEYDRIDRENLSQYFTSSKIEEGGSVYNRINGKSYVKNNNIGLGDLRYLKMLHINFNGDYQVGEMIVNADVTSDVLAVFEILCAEGYQINSMYLIDNYWSGNADDTDWYSIDANNTSAFCYRSATGSGNLSKHALGRAIDINPQQNPYVTYPDGKPKYSHNNAADYVSNRSADKPHVITTSDRAYQLFTERGWTWGGSWSSPKDYQHFQKS